MAKIVITDKEGCKQIITLPNDVANVEIVAEGIQVKTVLPKTGQYGYERATVNTIVMLNEIANRDCSPEVTLTAGEWDANGWTSRTDAMLYITNNGRIMARNQTLGYASTEKPVATKPWTRGK